MQIRIKARHTEIDQALKDYAEQKAYDKCATYLNAEDTSIACEVEFDDQFGPKGGEDKRVDITINLPHHHLPVHIEESDTTFREALDKALDRLDQPLAKYKETMKHL
jgi:ribosomal subunit interface protein